MYGILMEVFYSGFEENPDGKCLDYTDINVKLHTFGFSGFFLENARGINVSNGCQSVPVKCIGIRAFCIRNPRRDLIPLFSDLIFGNTGYYALEDK